MSAATDLQALLLATSAVTALCSTRISADRMEQAAATPFIVYTGTAEPQRSLDGSVHGTRTTFEIQCWADTRAAADALAAAVKTVLDAITSIAPARPADTIPSWIWKPPC
jgi:hypothetical protein